MKNLCQKIRRKALHIIMREKYYRDLEKMQEQYDTFLHDIRHMMRTIASLAQEGDCEKIGSLIKDARASLENIEWKMICSHKVLNALLVERKEYADKCGVALELAIKEPLYFYQIEDMDIVALVGNLLDNAIEAAKAVGNKGSVWCNIQMARNEQHVLIQIENSYAGKRKSKEKNKEKNACIGEKHGIGCKSVQDIVKKYGGMTDDRQENGRYRVKVILPVRTEGENAPAHLQKSASEGVLQQEW
ncbi:MAG: GHKL domain-containing protein [Eubacterium sp.]|nr:GHKL domain-containing protein [Eubacterium sp.]